MSTPAPRAAKRLWWQTVLAVVCAGAFVVNVARDLLFPAWRYVEVWFGFEVTGMAALVTAPLHWLLFAIGAWAAWNRLPWAVPVSAGYLFYVAISLLIWNASSPNGGGWEAGITQAAGIALFGVVLLQAHRSEGT